MILPRLVVANLAAHRMRLLLTVAAIALSVSLVVAVTSGYASAQRAARKMLSQYIGSTDVSVRPADYRGSLDEKLVAAIASQPEVKRVVERYKTNRALQDSEGNNLHGRVADVLGVDLPTDTDVAAQRLQEGTWFSGQSGDVAVVDQVVADITKLKVGDWLTIPDMRQPLKVRIVGIVHKPALLAERQQTIYLPLKTAQAFDNRPGKVSRIMVLLHNPSAAPTVARRLEQELEAIQPGLRIRAASDLRVEMERNLSGLTLLSYLAGAVSLLAATFIIFSTLSMGVSERSRTLAMLRAVGAGRGQLAAVVLMEGAMLALIGVAVGVPLGLGWVKTLVTWKHDLFSGGMGISTGGILMGSVGSIVAALIAGSLPAWNATRVSPLDALTPTATPPGRGVPLWCALIGLVLITVDPLLIRNGWLSPSGKYWLHFFLGLPTLMLGFFLLAPLFVLAVEWIGTGPVARLFAVPPALLRQQLSGGIWRAAGTASALMVGLAVLVVMQVQGNSLLDAWKLPSHFPDVFIFSPGGLDPPQQKQVGELPGIKPGEALPIIFTNAKLALDESKVAKELWPDSTMVFGVDPNRTQALIELEFRDDQGRQPEKQRERDQLATRAYAMLREGHALIVTDQFFRLYGLKLGDHVGVKTSEHGWVQYVVAGVVWSPGLDVMVSMYDLGEQFDQFTAGSVFMSTEDVRRDFGADRVYLMAANLNHNVDGDKLLNGVNGTPVPAPVPPSASNAIQPLSDNHAFTLDSMRQQVLTAVRKTLAQLGGLKVYDVSKIKNGIKDGFGRVLLVLSSVAFFALMVASLGVTNTIIASVRSRRWQFGVLRSIGVTGGQLFRLILAEALLLGVVGVVLGLTCGFELSYDANGLSQYLLGTVTGISVPWPMINIGIATVLGLSLLASIVPAIGLWRQEPLTLLQAGRAAT